MKDKMIKCLLLFFFGGLIYYGIEVAYRNLTSHTEAHPAMFLVGGVAFLLIGWINEGKDKNMPMIKQVGIGTCVVLAVEFLAGYILNIKLGLNIWDYSSLPFNIYGQVCLPFALIWVVLVFVGIVVDDNARWLLFDEDFPHYTWFKEKK